MKITILSKPEEITSKKGTKYWKVKITGEDLEEKTGSLFGCDTAPTIDDNLEVDEKYSEEYKSYSWFVKKAKKGYVSKPSMTVDQQIRAAALSEAVRHSTPETKSADIVKVAQFFETYIRG